MIHVQSLGLRLRLRYLWLRHSYTFRWAHGPLCDRFNRDIVRIGRMHLCRSCICAYCGLLLGTTLCICSAVIAEHAMAIILCMVAPTLLFSAPRVYERCPRPLRDLLRYGMGSCIALLLCAMWKGHIVAAGACGSVLIVFWRIYFKARHKRKEEACRGCAEMAQEEICSGCSIQAAGIRAYEMEATGILVASGLISATQPGSATPPTFRRDNPQHPPPQP